MNSAQRKAEQRKRRKSGFQDVSALVNMPKFVAWLISEGRIEEADAKNPAAIRQALERFLFEQYALMHEEPKVPEYDFKFARGSFGAEYTSLRDRPKEVVGILEREGECEWRDPPTRYLITRRRAVLRRVAPIQESNALLRTCPPGALIGEQPIDGEPTLRLPVEPTEGWPPPYQVPRYDYAEEGPEPPPDDYDPELNVEEESADMLDEALSEAFDVEGYETE